MAESSTQNASMALYYYLCQNIVGSKEHVKTLRLMNTTRDILWSNMQWTRITSGSFGEGLQMRGSDLDIMSVWKPIAVCEDTRRYYNDDNVHVHFKMELEDTQAGFTKLRLLHSKVRSILKLCNDIGNDLYLSNLLFKQKFSTPIISTVHGPCVSDDDGFLDFANCLHSKLWITPAKQWITRSNNSWPKYDVKQDIVKHGILFVPIGVKGSTQEELEWRLSFSVGEKLLIYSFTHTQLLCYTLMKIVLKDVISLDIDCKELLCSYFMKTILFWICEELPSSIWIPTNLIVCYMRCFRRLIYFVKYKVCPHYFIPEHNLFENKIKGHVQETLLNQLYILNSYDWQCILFSDQLSDFTAFASDIRKESSYLYAKGVAIFLNSFVFHLISLFTNDFSLAKVINKVLASKSSKIKYLFKYYLSNLPLTSERYFPVEDIPCNKYTYKEFNTCMSTLLRNTHHDAVSGWLMVASFFYKRKQYNTALLVIQSSLIKCTPEKLYGLMVCSDIHYELFKSDLIRNMTIVQLWKFLLLGFVSINNSKLQPDELQLELQTLIPPIVYAHFLRFLCHFHLKNSRHCWDCLRDLRSTIEENNLITSLVLKSKSYNILGMCFQLLGDMVSARQAFMKSIELFPVKKYNRAFQILSLLS